VSVLALAVLLDLAAGEPPGRWHPVTWIGGVISAGRRWAARRAPGHPVGAGALLLVVVIEAAVLGVLVVEHAARLLPGPLALLAQAWLLKLSFSLRGLEQAVELVRGHLVADDLAGARAGLSRHLVSRPTGDLDAGLVASAAVESLAENLTDSWVSPLCCFVAGAALGGVDAGIACAWAYRAVNTADAMIGYREAELERLGRIAARADDALNFLPARLAAWLLVAAAGLAGTSPGRARAILRRHGRRTASPNAGLTMAAMAGALGVTLEKRGHYRLGDGPAPDPARIDRALRVWRWAAALALALALVVLGALR
jgi:adenosylcobinamide-phosphate synthase